MDCCRVKSHSCLKACDTVTFRDSAIRFLRDKVPITSWDELRLTNPNEHVEGLTYGHGSKLGTPTIGWLIHVNTQYQT